MPKVRLTGIHTVSASQDYEKDLAILSAPIMELGLDVRHLPNDINIVDFTITYKLYTLHREPVFMLKTKSTFDIEVSMSYFYQEGNPLIEVLCNLATMSVAHNLGVYSVVTALAPISQANLLQLPSAQSFYTLIVEILNSRKNDNLRGSE